MFWGAAREAQRAAKKFFELLNEWQRDRYLVNGRYLRNRRCKDSRNGYYLRDVVTRFGMLRLRIAPQRKRGFLPEVIGKFFNACSGSLPADLRSLSAWDLDASGGT